MGGFTHSELAARLAEQAALAGGSSFEADIDLGGAEAARATVAEGIALRSLAGGQVILASDATVLVSGGAGPLTLAAGTTLTVSSSGGDVAISGANVNVGAPGELSLNGTPALIQGDGTTAVSVGAAGTLGFYATAPIAKQTGVAVTAAAIHAALVALGLIGA